MRDAATLDAGGDGGATDGGVTDSGADSGTDAQVTCAVDADCDDGVFCNGAEVCDPAASDADARGCTAAAALACAAGETCSETTLTCMTGCADDDADGHGAITCGGDDCDDTDANRYPGNTEICDAADVDEDCDPATFGSRDADGDGSLDAVCCNTQGDGSRLCGDDCDDLTRDVHPGAAEICDGRDNDCDGTIDEGVGLDGFADADGDGHGDPGAPLTGRCDTPGFAPFGDDCDDTNPRVHEGQVEVCDGLDDDCNGLVDDGATATDWYPDADADGFGDPDGTTVSACAPPAGYSLEPRDCDDGDANRNPAADEICDGLDDDCNGLADFEVAPGDFEDDDHDGYPDAACAGGSAVADCDDRDARAHPGATEICGDGIDNDCDGTVDSGCAAVDWYIDADGDGWGDESAATISSDMPVAGRVARGGDCDDARADISPSEREVCDGVDNDCDARIDELPEALTSCTVTPAATVSCAAGSCSSMCVPGFGDCDGLASNGCEAEVQSDVTHCGATCTSCDDGNTATTDTCVAGVCHNDLPTLTSISVTPSGPSLAAGLTLAFRATGSYSDSSTADITAMVTWSSTTSSVATIAATGVATGVTRGTTTIRATLGAVSGQTTLTVTSPELIGVDVTPATMTLETGATGNLVATANFTDGSTLDVTATATWTSTAPGIASVASGVVTAVSVGMAEVSATYMGAGATAGLTVTGPTLVSLAFEFPGPFTLGVPATLELRLLGTYSDGSVIDVTAMAAWSSSTPAAATVNGAGLATTLAAGTTTITATLSGQMVSYTLNVTQPQIRNWDWHSSVVNIQRAQIRNWDWHSSVVNIQRAQIRNWDWHRTTVTLAP